MIVFEINNEAAFIFDGGKLCGFNHMSTHVKR